MFPDVKEEKEKNNVVLGLVALSRVQGSQTTKFLHLFLYWGLLWSRQALNRGGSRGGGGDLV